ncbi:MAG: UDP-N-acetylmuramate--L-alanine ligase [bacterium JZ-2024 1]
MRAYFCGIGGSGVSSLAYVALDMGWEVSGADLWESDTVKKLRQAGAKVFIGHQEEQAEGADVVIYSTAASQDLPELQWAKRKGVPCWSRPEFLSMLFHQKPIRIAVTGSHGKTTVSALLSYIFETAGWSPSFVFGGELNHTGRGGKWTEGEIFIAEADESRPTFLQLFPTSILFTRIDLDHTDFYPDLQTLLGYFLQFAERVHPEGCIVINLNDSRSEQFALMLEEKNFPVVTTGFHPRSTIRGFSLHCTPTGSLLQVIINGREEFEIHTPLVGEYNTQNVLNAIGMAVFHCVPDEKWREAIRTFPGVSRRMQFLGKKNGVVYYSDYAHHPTEIAELLKSICGFGPPVVAVFQPHRYTRTRDFAEQFAQALQISDIVLITEIYPAGEPPIPEVSARKIVEAFSGKGKNVYYCPDKDALFSCLREVVPSPSIVLFIGAGNIHYWGIEYIKGGAK